MLDQAVARQGADMTAADTPQVQPMVTRPSADQIRSLDPYAFLAVLGKRVIHPGGRHSTQELLQLADLTASHQVLDIGCGVATTAIQVAHHYQAQVTAADLSPLMLARAQANVTAAGLDEQVTVEQADILALPYPDGAFDRVIAEAVTMFVDRPRAVAELVRVCRPGGRVLATEFCWRRPPTAQARQVFLGEVCPGLQVDTVRQWTDLYQAAGLTDLQATDGPFEMMTPSGFLADEGLANTLWFAGRAMARPSHLRKLGWLMPRMLRAVPYLGYVVIAATKPAP
jgi:SAM-dependent methyltransferase